MKRQLRKPSRTKARYIEEYKQDALELWHKSGRSAAKVALARRLRDETTVSLRWITENVHMWNLDACIQSALPPH
jgi:hypothetical protein